jgi:hypothetical protein
LESELGEVKPLVNEQTQPNNPFSECFKQINIQLPQSCTVPIASDQKIDINKCITDLTSMITKDPLTLGVEVGKIITCLKSKLNVKN